MPFLAGPDLMIFIKGPSLRKGVLGLFQTTHPPLEEIVNILTYHPQILHKIFENHLPSPPRKKIQKSWNLSHPKGVGGFQKSYVIFRGGMSKYLLFLVEVGG